MTGRKLCAVILTLLTNMIAACSGLAQGAGADPTLTPREEMGRSLFGQYCSSCHATTPDVVVVGPSLYGIRRTAAERVPEMDTQTYLETSIRDPGAYVVDGFENQMPSSLGETLTKEEVDALVAYLLTLE